MALAQGRSKLLLQDRTYFSLDHPAFDTLRELIREGEALAEWEPEHQQISRFQVDMWDDLQQMADETVTSEDWSSTALSLRTLEDSPPPELPRSLQAELRPYQREGFTWLSFLYSHRLGGVLADDMGLGKTVQTLALIARARERDPQAPPFLVVAPPRCCRCGGARPSASPRSSRCGCWTAPPARAVLICRPLRSALTCW